MQVNDITRQKPETFIQMIKLRNTHSKKQIYLLSQDIFGALTRAFVISAKKGSFQPHGLIVNKCI